MAGSYSDGLALFLVMMMGAPAVAQDAVASGSASASVVEPVRVKALSDLDFGCIAVSGDGSVRISAESGAGTYSGGVTRFDGGSGCRTSAAEFLVTGQEGREYRIAIDPAAEARNVENPVLRIAVTEMTGTSANEPSLNEAGRLDASGQDIVKVGGTLEVPAETTPGRYVAKIAVIVTYN